MSPLSKGKKIMSVISQFADIYEIFAINNSTHELVIGVNKGKLSIVEAKKNNLINDCTIVFAIN